MDVRITSLAKKRETFSLCLRLDQGTFREKLNCVWIYCRNVDEGDAVLPPVVGSLARLLRLARKWRSAVKGGGAKNPGDDGRKHSILLLTFVAASMKCPRTAVIK